MRTADAMSDIYFNDLAACAPLEANAERDMAREMAALRRVVARARGRELRRATRALADVRARFVRANLRLVVKLASRYADGKLPFADLVQEGNLGLLTAVDRFDHARGVRFCTYATWWIRHRISRAIAHHGRAVAVPAHVAQTATKLHRQRRRFEARHGARPSLEELAGLAGVDAAHALDALAATGRGLSLEAPRRGDRAIADDLADGREASDDELAGAELGRALGRALADLAPLELDILKRRFDPADGDPMTLRQIGAIHSLSRERVRQLQNQALAKLRERLERFERDSVSAA
jgi:RNA polymerase primary sigma factor